MDVFNKHKRRDYLAKNLSPQPEISRLQISILRDCRSSLNSYGASAVKVNIS